MSSLVKLVFIKYLPESGTNATTVTGRHHLYTFNAPNAARHLSALLLAKKLLSKQCFHHKISGRWTTNIAGPFH